MRRQPKAAWCKLTETHSTPTPMLAFILRRLIQAVIVMVTVAFISFMLFQYVGILWFSCSGGRRPSRSGNCARSWGWTSPSLFSSALSRQCRTGRIWPVACARAPRCPAPDCRALSSHLELALVAAFLALLVGVPMGVYAAPQARHFHQPGVHDLSCWGVAADLSDRHPADPGVFRHPGLVSQLWSGPVAQMGWWSTGLLSAKGWHHITLPAITLAIFQLTLIMRLVRAEMLEVLRTDYIKFARARGLSDRAIHFGHALKNTLVPVMTITGLQLGGLIAFAIITETVFQWPGMGLLFIQAVTFADIPVMAAYLCLIA